jgi:hypothetical protein
VTWGHRNVSRASILEVLGLEEEMVRRRAAAADACLGFYQSADNGLIYAGSMAVLAASCWTLTDTLTSRERWRQAADIYAGLAHPYAQILSVCAGNIAYPEAADSPRTTLRVSCRLLRLAWISVTVPQAADSCRAEVDALTPFAARAGATFSGQMLLPANYVHEFASTIVHDWSEYGINARISAATRRILIRAAVAVQSAQGDEYHWRRILPGFMPVEPEWLSIGRIVYEAVVRSNSSSEIISEGLTSIENLPMQIADFMLPPGRVDAHEPAAPEPPGDSERFPSREEDEAARQ